MSKQSIIIVLIITVLVAAGFIWRNQKMATIQKQEVASISPTISPIPTSSEVPGWKTYIHPSKLYSFSYPSDWGVRAYNTKDTIVVLDYPNGSAGKGNIHEIVFGKGGHDSLKGTTDETKHVIYGGKDATELTSSINNIPREVIVDFDEFPHDTKPYISSIDTLFPQTHQKEYLSLFHQILSTIRFSK